MRRNQVSTRAFAPALRPAALIAAAGLCATVVSTSSATVVSNFDVITQTDWTYGGMGGMRDNGVGSITISGVSGPVTQAYLLWGGPTASTNLSANANVTFNGSNVTGTFMGSSDSLCWDGIGVPPFFNSLAYRADVTSLVSGNGNYSLANFFKSASNVNVNGVSLLVFYNDGNNANNRDVYLSGGYDSNQFNTSDPTGMVYTENNVNFTGGTAQMVLGVSDGQVFADGDMNLNGNLFLTGLSDPFSGDSVPQGAFDQGLWDLQTYDITSAMSVGMNNLTLNEVSISGDCLAIYLGAISVAAAPIPEPATISVLALGGLFALRRWR